MTSFGERRSERFVPIPHRFVHARRLGELSAGAFEVGCWLAARVNYRTFDLSILLGELLRELGRPRGGRDTLARQLHELRRERWIDYDVKPGQRQPWTIKLNRLRLRSFDHHRNTEHRNAEVTSATRRPSGGPKPPLKSKSAPLQPTHADAAKTETETGAARAAPVPMDQQLAEFLGMPTIRSVGEGLCQDCGEHQKHRFKFGRRDVCIRCARLRDAVSRKVLSDG